MFQYGQLDSLKTLFSAHFYGLNLISIPSTTWKQTVMESHSTSSSNLASLCPGSAVCQISNGQFIFGKFSFIMKAIFGWESEHLKPRIGLQDVQNAGNVSFWVSLRCRQTKSPVYYISIDFLSTCHIEATNVFPSRWNENLNTDNKSTIVVDWIAVQIVLNGRLKNKTTIWNRVFALGSS